MAKLAAFPFFPPSILLKYVRPRLFNGPLDRISQHRSTWEQTTFFSAFPGNRRGKMTEEFIVSEKKDQAHKSPATNSAKDILRMQARLCFVTAEQCEP